jgi:F-type H+-transporting ATPase subunit delta
MADASLARRYARALLQLGRSDGAVDLYANDLGRIGVTLDVGGGQLRAALVNPGLSLAERRGVLDAVLGRLGLAPTVQNFLRLLLDKNRFFALADIERAYLAMADELAGRVRARVRTARALDAAGQADVQRALSSATGKHVLVQFSVDSSLIGGMVAQVGDKVYDASVATRLAHLQHTLASAGTSAEA